MNSLVIVANGNTIEYIAVVVSGIIVKYIYTTIGLYVLKNNWYVISKMCNVEAWND